jgi:two-component system, cell cycle sensor histidine kinase and response regulator CckA
LLTDLVLPGLSGSDLAEQLRVEREGIRVLFTSGFPPDVAVRYGVDPSAAFLQKPFRPLNLLRRVRDLLDETA